MRQYTSQTSVGGYVTTVTVIEEEQYNSSRFIFSGKLSDFKDMIDSLISEIPEEHLDTAKIEIDSVSSYESSSYASVSVKYDRPATKEEADMYKHYLKNREDVRRVQELAQLNALKAKYGV